MELQTAQSSDLPFILDAESHVENAPYVTQCSKAWHEAAIASKDFAYFIAQKHGPIGYAILAGLQSPHRSLEIRRIVVTQKGQGYGREILLWIKAFAFEQLGYHRLWLDVLESNHRAKHLYESEGFLAEGILRDSFKTKTGYESMILMSMLEREYSRSNVRALSE